jgi:hypothetical protein
MKATLNVIGKVELTRHELSKLILEHVTKAGFKPSKVVYNVIDGSFKGADVKLDYVDQTAGKLSKAVTKAAVKKRVYNWGLAEAVREYLNSNYNELRSAFKGGHISISFDDLYAAMKRKFDSVNRVYLINYLYDKSQFTNISWDSGDNITVTGIVRREADHE